MRKPTLPEVLPLAQRVYDRSVVGCCAHIVLDDDNVADHHVKFCLDQAISEGHDDCRRLCEALMACSRTQRLRLGDMVRRVPNWTGGRTIPEWVREFHRAK